MRRSRVPLCAAASTSTRRPRLRSARAIRSHGRIDHGVARRPAAHEAHARLADVHAAAPRPQPGRAAVERREPLGPPAPECAPAVSIGARRQHAFAGADRRNDLDLAVAHARRRRAARPRRRRPAAAAPASIRDRGREQRRRIGAGIGREVGAHRPAVAQRAAPRADARADRRHRPPSTRPTAAASSTCARRDRLDERVDAREHVVERRQPGDPLRRFGFQVIVIRGHYYIVASDGTRGRAETDEIK